MRIYLSLLGASLLCLTLGATGAAAFSEQTIGGASTGGSAKYQDPDDLLNTQFDAGATTSDDGTGLMTKTAPTSSSSKSGFSFSLQDPQGALGGSNAQPYGPWTIPRN